MTTKKGEPSRTITSAGPEPLHAAVTVRDAPARLRNAFTITSRRSSAGHGYHLITAPKHGPDRAQARRAIVAVLQHAEQHRHRVSFLITLGDYTQRSLNPRRGYDPGVVLVQCQIAEADPYAWLHRQPPLTAHSTGANSIIGVTINTWPQPEPQPEP